MGKLVVLRLGEGSFEQGFPVTLQIGDEAARPSTEVTGTLPANPDILHIYQQWRLAYRQLGLRSRLSAPSQQITNISVREACQQAAQMLRDNLNRWLGTEPFRVIREKLLEKLSPSDEIRVVLQTKDLHLQRLPWHLWDFFDRYPKAEAAFSAPIYEWSERPPKTHPKVNILAVLGNSSGIDVQADRRLLEQLSGAEINFLAEPTRRSLTDQFWRQSWDILFFAGHSSTQVDTETGWIEINATERLTIAQLKYALKKGVERGLRVAIFNSCDGLGLAQNLADLRIPQIIVMRDPVPDLIAQAFLQNFLEAYAGGTSFYLSVREARERLEGLEDEFPCATWLPIIFQHPVEIPPTWEELCGGAARASFIHTVAEPKLNQPTVLPSKPEPPTKEPVEAVPALLPEAPVPPGPPPAKISETPNSVFQECCRQELAKFVGPIAHVLIKAVLAKHAQAPCPELIEILAAQIPNPQQALEFRQRLTQVLAGQPTKPLLSPRETSSPATGVATIVTPQPGPRAQADAAFLARCRRELATCIGPIASHMLKTTLLHHPQASPQQLVELLANTIPDSRQAAQFRQHLSGP